MGRLRGHHFPRKGLRSSVDAIQQPSGLDKLLKVSSDQMLCKCHPGKWKPVFQDPIPGPWRIKIASYMFAMSAVFPEIAPCSFAVFQIITASL